MFEGMGLGLVKTSEVRRMVEGAILAEELGFHSIWIAEDYFQGGAFSVATACAMATTRVQVGIGVVNPFTRHPALLAMETATLDVLSEGRVILGLGTGASKWIRQMGFPFLTPLAHMRECTELVKRLLQGEEVTFRGRCFSLDGVQLEILPHNQEVPIYHGVKGPKALELAGELADGVHLAILTSVPYVKYAKRQVAKGAQKAGRNVEEIKIAAYLPIILDRHADRAMVGLRSTIARYIGLMGNLPILAEAGMTSEQVQQFVDAAERKEDAWELVTRELVKTFAVVGSPDECVEQLQEYIQAGVNTIIALDFPGVPMDEIARGISEHILPGLR